MTKQASARPTNLTRTKRGLPPSRRTDVDRPNKNFKQIEIGISPEMLSHIDHHADRRGFRARSAFFRHLVETMLGPCKTTAETSDIDPMLIPLQLNLSADILSKVDRAASRAGYDERATYVSHILRAHLTA